MTKELKEFWVANGQRYYSVKDAIMVEGPAAKITHYREVTHRNDLPIDRILAAASIDPLFPWDLRDVSTAAAFGSAAYDASTPDAAPLAFVRAFCVALRDANDAELDHLRADPSAGAAARDADNFLTKAQNP